uniref:Uncharacterized protein n=1 Tax=Arundo donax TaxID=35708 RepID=A0A0A8Z8C2_ARUDO
MELSATQLRLPQPKVLPPHLRGSSTHRCASTEAASRPPRYRARPD